MKGSAHRPFAEAVSEALAAIAVEVGPHSTAIWDRYTSVMLDFALSAAIAALGRFGKRRKLRISEGAPFGNNYKTALMILDGERWVASAHDTWDGRLGLSLLRDPTLRSRSARKKNSLLPGTAGRVHSIELELDELIEDQQAAISTDLRIAAEMLDDWILHRYIDWQASIPRDLCAGAAIAVRNVFAGAAQAFVWHRSEGGVYLMDAAAIQLSIAQMSQPDIHFHRSKLELVGHLLTTRLRPGELFPLDDKPRRIALDLAPYSITGLDAAERTLYGSGTVAGQRVAAFGDIAVEAWYPWPIAHRAGPILENGSGRVRMWIRSYHDELRRELAYWCRMMSRGRADGTELPTAARAILAGPDGNGARYPIAISCARKSVPLVQALVERIETDLGRGTVFFYADSSDAAKRVLNNGGLALDGLLNLYRGSEMLLGVFSEDYQSAACATEFRAIQERLANSGSRRSVLLYSFDGTTPFGITPADLYDRIASERIDAIAKEVQLRLREVRSSR